jgi:DNA-binding NarL/FixJ family response regulator
VEHRDDRPPAAAGIGPGGGPGLAAEGSLIGAGRWPLVGRAAERAVLRDVLTGRPGRGIVIDGPAGVGKSRLAAALLDDLAGSGWSTRRLVATRAAAGIPFGSLAPLLGDPADRADALDLARGADLLTRLRHHITVQRNEVGLVVGLDDLHLLDDASAALVFQLVSETDTLVVATLRGDEPRPDAVTALWKEGLVEYVELAPLPPAELRMLVRAVLGGAVGHRTAADLARLSDGNCLLLRELIRATHDAGRLSCAEGVWELRGPLPSSARLVEMIEDRTGHLPPATRSAVELVALAEPVPLAVLEQVTEAGAVDDAARRGLLDLDGDDRRATVVLTHPLYGEVVAGRIPALQARAARRALASAYEATGLRRADDVGRFVAWRLECGMRVPAHLLVSAARRALAVGDHPSAETFAREAALTPPVAGGDDLVGTEARLLRVETLLLLGRHAEARDLIDAIEPPADAVLAAVHADRRATVEFLVDRDIDAALALLTAAEASNGDRLVLVWARARLLLLANRVTEALDVLDGFTAATLSPTGHVPLIEMHATALVMGGRLGEAAQRLAVLPAGGVAGTRRPDGPADRDEPVSAWHLLTRLGIAFGRADVHEAARLGDQLLENTRRTPHVVLRRLAAVSAGWVRYQQGRLDEAESLLRSGLATVTPDDPGFGVLAAGTLALVLIDTGDLDGAAGVLARHRDCPVDGPFGEAMISARALLAHREGTTSVAVGLMREGFAACRRTGNELGSAILALTGVRAGAETAALVALAGRTDHADGLDALLVPYAAALGDDDGPALEACSEHFERAGLVLLAAEAAARAAEASPWEQGDRVRQRARARAERLYARCPGAVAAAVAPTTPDALTRRETEVARLAARGLTTPQIAERLTLSARTVECHLGRAYYKLGVSGRAELAAIDSLMLARSGPRPLPVDASGGASVPGSRTLDHRGAPTRPPVRERALLRPAERAELAADPDRTVTSAAPPVEIRVLCPAIEVRRRGVPVAVRPMHARLLLGLVLAHPTPVHIERASELLWPGQPVEATRRRLNNEVHRLRGRLGAAAVVRRGDLLSLSAGDCAVDLVAYRAALAGPVADRLDALARVTGALCEAQLPYDEMLIGQRHRFVAEWTRTAEAVVDERADAVERLRPAAAALGVELDDLAAAPAGGRVQGPPGGDQRATRRPSGDGAPLRRCGECPR